MISDKDRFYMLEQTVTRLTQLEATLVTWRQVASVVTSVPLCALVQDKVNDLQEQVDFWYSHIAQIRDLT